MIKRLLKPFRRWIAYKLCRYMEWLEFRPNHSMWWYRRVYRFAHWIYPITWNEWHKYHPPEGIGLNAMETEHFWQHIEIETGPPRSRRERDWSFEDVHNFSEYACSEAALSANDFAGEAINWGDLHCIEVLMCEDEKGREFWLVKIEEAAPESSKLCEFVRTYLSKRGIDAEVKTEW